MSIWIYPLLVHWTWGKGWLETTFENYPYKDLAGGGIVHVTGGFCGLVGAIVVGARIGRWD